MFDLTFTVEDKGAGTPLTLAIDKAVIAGWTGRDPVARDKHIAELEAIGIARPATTPIYYRVSARRYANAGRRLVSGHHATAMDTVARPLKADSSKKPLGTSVAKSRGVGASGVSGPARHHSNYHEKSQQPTGRSGRSIPLRGFIAPHAIALTAGLATIACSGSCAPRRSA